MTFSKRGSRVAILADLLPNLTGFSVGRTVGKLKTAKCCVGTWNLMSLMSILFIALESLTLLQMRFPEFTALAWMGVHFMISMPRCVTRASHVCITLFVRKIYRFLLKMFAKQFAFPWSSVDAKTVISCLHGLFALFGLPAYINSDRGTAFMSHALTSYLHRHGVACSKTSV